MKLYRKEKLASVIRTVVGTAITQRLQDPRVAPLTTVTRVELSTDLLIARVFVSVPGGDAVERRTIAALQHATGFVQRLVARELSIRHCPELRIDVDESLKIARRTMALLDESLPAQDTDVEEGAEDIDGVENAEEVDAGSPDRTADGDDPIVR